MVKLKRLSVGLAVKKGRARLPKTKQRVAYSERKILLGKKELMQRTSFTRNKNELLIEIRHANGVVGKLPITIHGVGKERIASIGWASVEKKFQKSGIYLQLLSEAMSILKKSGVEVIVCEAYSGRKTLEKLGFQFKRRFGETHAWKDLRQ
jgi:ribosomal protein S18 acetylase RimI-like enzyme